MERGFSLVESLVVVALLGLMLSLAVPELQRVLARSQVQAAAQAFVRDMSWARSEALKRSMRIGVCTSSNGLVCGAQGWAGGWLVFVDDNGNGLLDGQDELLRTQSALHGVLSMASSNPNNDRLQFVFQSQGVARAAAQSLLVKSQAGEQQRLVCVSMQGRAALRPSGDLLCE
jgi:type IV fimbrial biogenesis protein FimT